MKIIVNSYKEKAEVIRKYFHLYPELVDKIEVKHKGKTFKVATKEDNPDDEWQPAGSIIYVYEEFEGKYYGFETSSHGTYSTVIDVEKCKRVK